MISQVLDKYDVLVLVAVVLSTYTYVAFSFRKTPKPKAEFTISPKTLLTFLLSFAALLVSLFCILLTGTLGYLIVAILIPPLIRKIVKKMTVQNA